MRTFALAFGQTRCSAVGSVPGLGPGCRRFESCHLDHPNKILPLTFNKLAAFFVLASQDLKSLRHALDLGRFACKELTYEIENPDIKDEFTIKF